MKVLGNLKKGLLFVLSAPAGAGKTTLATLLKREFNCVASSVSYKTRKSRTGEKEGVDYHFISKEEFEKKIENQDFLEHAKVFESYYGTDRKRVEELQNQGKHVLLVIDVQGGMQIKRKTKAVFIFISPPSFEVLKKRLVDRQTETESKIAERLSWAKKEMEAAKDYDYQIINEDLNVAYDVLRSIVIAEEHRS
jgi:guanylate kinase